MTQTDGTSPSGQDGLEEDGAGPRRAAPRSPAAALRVASYNIRKAIGRDARRDPNRILDLVATLDADVVALQEADYRFKGRAALFDLEAIAARTHLKPIDLGHGGAGLGWHGNVVLVRDASRLDVLGARCLELPGLEPRGAVLADLGLGGRRVRVLAAHLGLLARYRRLQSEAIMREVEADGRQATLVMGDFNGWGRAPNSLRLFEDGFSLAPTGRSYPSRSPVAPLDRIYFDDRLTVRDCGTVTNGTARIASDHLPIWADFDFADTDQSSHSTGR